MTTSWAQLSELRVNRGLSLRAAATEIGVAEGVLRLAESGESRPHPRNAFKIASFYGFKVTDLWPLDDERVPA